MSSLAPEVPKTERQALWIMMCKAQFDVGYPVVYS